MSTDITPDEFLAHLTKWGVEWRFYSTKADWLTHNRNAAGANTSVTPGGFGPIRGSVKHNTASTSQTGMLEYLYRGDGPTSSKPGPLCQVAIPKVGPVVLMGWGTATHAGPGDKDVEAVARRDELPLDRELKPDTNGTSTSGVTAINPFYLADESMHAAEGPNDHQRRQAVLVHCAILDLLGGPTAGYSAGSVLMHRELTTARSDPQGWAPGEFRRAVAAQLKAGPPKRDTSTSTPPAPAPALIPVATTIKVDRGAITYGESVGVTVSASPSVPGIFVLQRLDTATGKWVTWASKATVSGAPVTVPARPGVNTQYRVGFDPSDAKYRNGNYSEGVATVVVVDLVRLLVEHKAYGDRIAALEAGAATPTPDLTPGD